MQMFVSPFLYPLNQRIQKAVYKNSILFFPTFSWSAAYFIFVPAFITVTGAPVQ